MRLVLLLRRLAGFELASILAMTCHEAEEWLDEAARLEKELAGGLGHG